jgi:hypothetical protein
MKNKRLLIINRILKYEWDYFLRKFKPIEILYLFISIFAFVITGLGDTQSFFIGDSSPIPDTWTILKNTTNIRIISILVLVIPSLMAIQFERQQRNKENNDIVKVIKEYVIPNTNHYLSNFQDEIKNTFQIETRVSLWIPVRLNCFHWNLQMICKTSNVPEQELEASFDLDEGVIGYTYLRNRGRYKLETVDVSNSDKLPSSYVHLKDENKLLITSDIKGVLALLSFQGGSIVGLLAIDVNDINDLSIIEKVELHTLAVGMMTHHNEDIQLLWRMKNRL